MIQKTQISFLLLLSLLLSYSSNQFYCASFAQTSSELKQETPQLAPENAPVPQNSAPSSLRADPPNAYRGPTNDLESTQKEPGPNSVDVNNEPPNSFNQGGQYQGLNSYRQNYQSQPGSNPSFRPYQNRNYAPESPFQPYQNQSNGGGYGYSRPGGYGNGNGNGNENENGQYRQQNYNENSYHLTPSRYYGAAAYQPGSPYSARPNVVYAPQGTMLPMKLQTAISTQVAQPGDLIQGQISQMVSLGGRGYIPAGSQVVGEVSRSTKGRRLSRSGLLSFDFTSLRLPSGKLIPIQAHLVGNVSKYKNKGQGEQNVFRGEGWGTKVGQLFLRGVGGAGLGAALGTGLGAIAGGGSGVGRGAWGGAAIGGGIGAADMLLRKGKDVIIPSGTEVEIQLDQEAALPSFAQNPNGNGSYSGAF